MLPKSTLQTLSAARASLLHLPHDPDDRSRPGPFHDEHHPADDRWSHAKLYSIRRGRARRLLITSANFSPAAWGREAADGSLVIENFELGVCIDKADWPFELDVFEDKNDIATVSLSPNRDGSLITWARAVWDGQKIMIECRCLQGRQLDGELRAGSERIPIENWQKTDDPSLRTARLSWKNPWEAPFVIDLTCEGKTISVAIFDERPSAQRASTLPPEVDQDLMQTMIDQLVLEQYGGRVASDEPGTGDDDGAETSGDDPIDGPDISEETGGSDSYAVPTFVLARRHFEVVDNWCDALRLLPQGDAGTFERALLRRDGEMLVGAFLRQAKRDEIKARSAGIGATLASDELALRLKHFAEA